MEGFLSFKWNFSRYLPEPHGLNISLKKIKRQKRVSWTPGAGTRRDVKATTSIMLHWGSCVAICAGMSFRPKNCHGLNYFGSLPTPTTQQQREQGQLACLRLNLCKYFSGSGPMHWKPRRIESYKCLLSISQISLSGNCWQTRAF